MKHNHNKNITLKPANWLLVDKQGHLNSVAFEIFRMWKWWHLVTCKFVWHSMPQQVQVLVISCFSWSSGYHAASSRHFWGVNPIWYLSQRVDPLCQCRSQWPRSTRSFTLCGSPKSMRRVTPAETWWISLCLLMSLRSAVARLILTVTDNGTQRRCPGAGVLSGGRLGPAGTS